MAKMLKKKSDAKKPAFRHIKRRCCLTEVSEVFRALP